MSNNDIMIIPDVHGRTFWKEAKNFDGKIIFLGDYVDPYTRYEPITKNDALDNFKEIIEFAKVNKNVILLVGNHDMTYFFSTNICECRTDWDNFVEIKDLFRNNADLFKLAHYENYNGKEVIFTHAYLNDEWLKDSRCTYESAEDITTWLNLEFQRVIDMDYDKDAFISKLAKVSWLRGGWSNYSSVVWGDIRECEGLLKDETKPLNIFGHTQLDQDGAYVIIGNCICIDSRKIFSLNNLIDKYGKSSK